MILFDCPGAVPLDVKKTGAQPPHNNRNRVAPWCDQKDNIPSISVPSGTEYL